MSLLDRVTKAVGDAVDRGKKEVDQFVRIQKINGEISDMEKNVAEFKGQIQQARQLAGEKAIELLRAGALVCPDLLGFVEQVSGFEKQIAAEEDKIAGKKVEIEKIKAEHEAEKADSHATPQPGPAEASAPTSAPPVRFCSQCGAQLTSSGAFCPQCGSKLG